MGDGHILHARPRFGATVFALAALFGLAVACYLSSRGMTNLYGDGVAHLNIARKIVDARDAGLWDRYVQLGSPWLPLPHVVMLPFVWSDALWRSGWAGTIPSLAAYAAGVWLAYRVGFDAALVASATNGAIGASRVERSALLGAAVLAFDPSVLYLAATPMTETLFVALLLASVFALERWARAPSPSALGLAALAVAAATLTRYEGWALVPAGAAVVALLARGEIRARASATAAWTAAASSGIVYWLWHNWAIYGDGLEFLRGPYSARAIFAAHAERLGWAGFVVGNPLAALGWALLTVAVVAGPATLAVGIGGLASFVAATRRRWPESLPFLVALAPFALLVASLARGEIQIYPLAALALLNVRYGAPYVAAIAILAPPLAVRRSWLPLALAIVVAAQYAHLLGEGWSQLAIHQEAARNSRNSAEWRERREAAAWLAEHPPAGLVLMEAGDLGPLVPASGLRFRDVVHEGTREWHEWLAAGEVAPEVSTVVARKGDTVWERTRSSSRFEERFTRAFATAGDRPIEVWERTLGANCP